MRGVAAFVAAIVALAACGDGDAGAGDPAGAAGDAGLVTLPPERDLPPVDGLPVLGFGSDARCERVVELDPVLLDLVDATLPGIDAAAVVALETGGVEGVAVTPLEDGRVGDPLVLGVVDDGLVALDERTLAVVGGDAAFVLPPGGEVAPGSPAVLLAIGQDCALALGQASVPPPPRPEPALREDLLDVAPDPAAPGEVVSVTFAEEFMRGVAWRLDRAVGDGWEPAWWMTSDANGGRPSTVAVGADGIGWPDVGIGGRGPDRVLVHPETEPGDHRLCTANAVEDVCVRLTVAP